MQGRYITNIYPSKASQIILIALFSTALRLILWLSVNSWTDAVYSMSLSHLSVFDMVGALTKDVGEPLYYLILKCWMAVFGNSESMAALLSALISSCTPVIVYCLACVIFGTKAALIAGLLMAINPGSLEMSSYVNFYSLIELLSATSFLYFMKILQDKSDVRIGYVIWGSVVAILGVYTHSYFWLLLMSQTVACVFFFKNKLRAMIAIFFFAVGAFMSWGPVVWVQLHHTVTSSLQQIPGLTAAIDLFLDTLTFKVLGGGKFIDIFKIAFCLSASYLTFRLVITPPDEDIILVDDEGKALTLWFCIIFCMVIPIAISMHYPIYLPGRYDTIINPALVVICSYYLSRCFNLVIILVFVALLLNMVSASDQTIRGGTRNNIYNASKCLSVSW